MTDWKSRGLPIDAQNISRNIYPKARQSASSNSLWESLVEYCLLLRGPLHGDSGVVLHGRRRGGRLRRQAPVPIESGWRRVCRLLMVPRWIRHAQREETLDSRTPQTDLPSRLSYHLTRGCRPEAEQNIPRIFTTSTSNPTRSPGSRHNITGSSAKSKGRWDYRTEHWIGLLNFIYHTLDWRELSRDLWEICETAFQWQKRVSIRPLLEDVSRHSIFIFLGLSTFSVPFFNYFSPIYLFLLLYVSEPGIGNFPHEPLHKVSQ